MVRSTAITVILILVVFCFGVAVQAQTTAFSYQGRLTSNSSAANGSYDFQFALFDALTGGAQIGTVSKTGVAVTNGVFSVTLDFGAAAFPGADRFLEISAKLSTDSTFTTLTPRQQIDPNPYAIRAQSATNADNASNAATATNSTQLGGVAASQYVTTTSANTNFIQNQTSSSQNASFKISGSGTVGNLTVTGTLTATLPAGSTSYIQNTTSQQASSNFNISGSGTAGGNLSTTASVGVGITSPNFRLHIVDSGIPSIRVDGSNTAGAWLQLNNTSTGGHNWGILSTGAGNGEGAGNLVMIDENGGGKIVMDDPLTVNSTINTTSQYNINSNRVLGISGTNNTFVGVGSGAANTGTSNVFMGTNAGQNNTGGSNNTFLGSGAGLSNLTGSSNTAVGSAAGSANTSVQNTFIGSAAGKNNTSGIQNVFLGASSGASNTTENSNTFLGFNSNGASGIVNSTAIGANATVTSTNAIVLGSLTDFNNQPTDIFVGIGVTSPRTKLHVIEDDSGVFRVIRVEGSSTTGVWSELVNTSTGGHTWALISAGTSNGEGAGNLVISDETGGGTVFLNNPLRVPSCTGCTTVTSDRNVKSNVAAVDSRSVLERLIGIPIQTWNYNSDPKTVRHIGPMAQDFFAAFGVGTDDKHINLLDEGGVALAAIQELYKINQAKDQQINDLKASNADLTKRIDALEKIVEKLSKEQH